MEPMGPINPSNDVSGTKKLALVGSEVPSPDDLFSKRSGYTAYKEKTPEKPADDNDESFQTAVETPESTKSTILAAKDGEDVTNATAIFHEEGETASSNHDDNNNSSENDCDNDWAMPLDTSTRDETKAEPVTTDTRSRDRASGPTIVKYDSFKTGPSKTESLSPFARAAPLKKKDKIKTQRKSRKNEKPDIPGAFDRLIVSSSLPIVKSRTQINPSEELQGRASSDELSSVTAQATSQCDDKFTGSDHSSPKAPTKGLLNLIGGALGLSKSASSMTPSSTGVDAQGFQSTAAEHHVRNYPTVVVPYYPADDRSLVSTTFIADLPGGMLQGTDNDSRIVGDSLDVAAATATESVPFSNADVNPEPVKKLKKSKKKSNRKKSNDQDLQTDSLVSDEVVSSTVIIQPHNTTRSLYSPTESPQAKPLSSGYHDTNALSPSTSQINIAEVHNKADTSIEYSLMTFSDILTGKERKEEGERKMKEVEQMRTKEEDEGTIWPTSSHPRVRSRIVA